MEPLPRPSGGIQNRASTILAIFWVPYPILVILIAARISVRIKIQSLGLDDLFMVLAWITISVSNSVASYYLVRGGGRHLFYLNPNQITLILKWSFLNSPIAFMSAVFGKSSVAIFLLRIIGPVSTWRRRFIYGNFILYWATTVVVIVVGIVRCSPVRSVWEKVPGSTCKNPNVLVSLSIFQGAHGTFIDFGLALLPVTIISGLQMDLKRKIGLCTLLGLGILAGIASLVKTINLQALRAQTDFVWATYSLSIWGPVETFIVIICGCIPTVMPLFDWLVKGKPIRPARHRFTNPYGYQMHASSDNPARRNVAQRFKDWTQASSNRGLDSHSSPEGDQNMEMCCTKKGNARRQS